MSALSPEVMLKDRFSSGGAGSARRLYIADMDTLLLANESVIRLTAFAAVLIAVALAEAAAPRRQRRTRRLRRWPVNLAMVGLGALLIRIAVPLIAVEAALLAEERGWGLLNAVDLPAGFEIVSAVLALDLVIYGQHVAFHHVPLLWRMHRMHHADPDLDVTTGLRFHPFEFVISMAIKVGAVLLLGASAAAVIVFEVLLNATAMFNHGNLRLPAGVDRFLRLVLVTPDFHAVHHSVERAEHDRNFGFNLPWWDYLFRTYKSRPDLGADAVDIGLRAWRGAQGVGLANLLIMPFRNGERRIVAPKGGRLEG